MKHSLTLFFAVLFSGLAAPSIWAQGSAQGSIVLARVQGAVSVMERATQTTVAGTNGMRISEGYVVTTAAGSSVILVFSNGSTVNLGADSLLDIEVFLQDPFEDDLQLADLEGEPTGSTTRLNLTRGEAVGDVKRLSAEARSSFEIRTPAGAAGIRGTTFRVTYRVSDDGRASFSLTLLDGTIAFTPVVVDGGVASPVLVGDLQELSFDVTVDATSGAISVTVPTGGLAVTPVSDAVQVAVAAVVQQVVEAVAQVILTPVVTTASGSGGGTGDSGTSGTGEGGTGGGETGGGETGGGATGGTDGGTTGGTGTQSTGTQSTGTQSTGTQSTGTQSTGTQGTGTQSTGTQPPGAGSLPRTTPGDGRP